MMTTAMGSAGSRDERDVLSEGESVAGSADGRALRTLSPAECFDLLEPGGVGRVGFNAGTGS